MIYFSPYLTSFIVIFIYYNRTEDVVEFKGKFYNIPASKIGPKPIQKPHIPIYYGRV
jgi:alkanesulfonate monooxygenase SsuD/methylene tetrahydromethanopterin reductase-like flavin-dependent oxidoreductase (luciferase family)